VSTVKGLVESLSLHTICQSAHCPNIGSCFSQKTATFLILGDVCTRNCTFCAVENGSPSPVDEEEPQRILEAVDRLGLGYVVITSVTRDDLPDGGASQFATIVNLLHREGITTEVLIPDFLGSTQAVKTVADAHPEVVSHNIETVPRLYPEVRPGADYERSLQLLLIVKRPEIITKSGLMLGLGETGNEVIRVMNDLREAGCDLLTIGQYLQPSPRHHPVVRFVPPEEFLEYQQIGRDMGFIEVAADPLVRSSFRAAELYTKVKACPA
jgi:lipoic acid synthetase